MLDKTELLRRMGEVEKWVMESNLSAIEKAVITRMLPMGFEKIGQANPEELHAIGVQVINVVANLTGVTVAIQATIDSTTQTEQEGTEE